MTIINKISELEIWLRVNHRDHESLGFVPTMGALHRGHLSLVRYSQADNHRTVCSIFVNPIQFNRAEDLAKYPRMPEEDIRMLEREGCDMVFLPSVEEMYPEKPRQVYRFGPLEEVMEGAFRPGHFNGVAIVVNRFFRMIRPDKAYFGLKDYQQYLIIKEMVRQDQLPVEVIGCPIVRESDGLAMSSRNLRLSEKQRATAPVIFRALSAARDQYRSHTPESLENYILRFFADIPECRPEYVSVANADTLQPVKHWSDARSAVVCVAAYFGEIRLIDNILLY
ncbi:MAG TPA: pantoate--beta-alanine ligase [Bacteroidales bacterium]|nr:pantoate--beta-alanine ligase [Bacteroidales bacterium]HRZ48190.1 pantoate--beta-alanine ligase [Bacteroidales bacterium]